jgi:AraC-like DNA-binding protein
LRDDARQQAAEAYLGNAALSITEVTYLLGYSEPTAFHRAFKRWHPGVTPQAFRAKALASADTDAAAKVVVARSERARRSVSGRRHTLAGRK